MSQRFIRCAQCGIPHDAIQAICPSTREATSQRKSSRPSGLVALGAPPWPPPRRDLVGKTVAGKYVMRRVLGGGGMGTVFEAEHLIIGRSVAVKVLHPNLALKKEAVQRFYREARAAGCIRHPNVCEVYDLDKLNDGTPYLVMEKLLGETLANRIAREGKLPLYDLVDVLVQVLSALIAAHEKGIVHRDIKPDNVFLARRPGCQPLAKLLDFGVSKTGTGGALPTNEEDDVDLTRRGMVVGTPHYMSPEQARGDRDLDARVDLYACGVILYEALTGHRPFVAPTLGELLRDILSAKPRPARELRRALPLGFDAVLGKAMARDRNDRYRTAGEFQRELQSLRDPRRHFPIRAKAVRALPPPSTPVAQNDEPLTQIWKGRSRSLGADDVAPTQVMVRPSRVASDDQDTIVRPWVSDGLARAERGL
jgi:eukaryotic-like serine/threonine-protein kinase